MKTIVIMWGLPGSGKTHYAKEKVGDLSDYGSEYLDLDRFKALSKDKVWTRIKDKLFLLFSSKNPTIIIDGLFTTNNQVETLIKDIKTSFPKKEIQFEIIFFKEDRESCIWNDQYRRDQNSSITIKNHPFEEPSEELVKKYNIKVEKKKVVRKSNYQVWLNKYGLPETGILASDTWSLGGTSGNYSGNDLSTIHPDPQPESFRKFDDLLIKLCPNIGFLTYKKVYRESVNIETRSEGDYYGGRETYAHFECNLFTLYKLLKEMNLIKG